MIDQGISASQIVQDINSIQRREPRRLEKMFQELETKHNKWKQLQRAKMEQRIHENISSREREGVIPMIINWCNAAEKQPIGEVGKDIADVVLKWWQRTSSQIQETYNDIQEVLRVRSSNEFVEKQTVGAEQEMNHLVRKGNIFRRDSLDPLVASKFDVAVVLLGLNDLKEAFMPHVTQEEDSSFDEGTDPFGGALNNQLRGVFSALQNIMGKMDKLDEKAEISVLKDGSESMNRSRGPLHPPLVVVPELPVAPLEAFKLVPLCWFLLPLFRAMERNKKFLSATFPKHVVFVDQPDLQWWSEAESRATHVHNSYKEDEVLKLTDIAQTAQSQAKQLMRKFYNSKEEGAGDYQEGNGNSGPDKAADGLLDFNESSQPSVERASKGKVFIAQDKMHPNDEGYDLWGHHIALAVVRHWDRPRL